MDVMEEKMKCKHPPCTCTARPMQEYCCDSCQLADEREQAGEIPMEECHCKHPHCGGQPDIPIETESIHIASAALAEA
jgi:hypothetical protein